MMFSTQGFYKCKYAACAIPLIRNRFSDCHLDAQAAVPSHHLKAGMTFRPYRQQGAWGHTEVHKRQGHSPYRLQTRHPLLTGCTSSHSCEVDVYFFQSPADGIFADWYVKHSFGLFLQQPKCPSEMSLWRWTARSFDDTRLCPSIKFFPCIIGINVTVQRNNAFKSFFRVELYRICNDSHIYTVCFCGLFMGKDFTMCLIQINQDLASVPDSFCCLFFRITDFNVLSSSSVNEII